MEYYVMNTIVLQRPADAEVNAQLQPQIGPTKTIFPDGFPWVEKPKTYHHSIDVYLKDSNATGNIYFARYFEWQGICRERWFFECVAADMLQDLGVFITKEAQQNYVHETFAFQTVKCEVNTFAIKQCSFSLLFRFYVNGTLVSTGYQQIVFANKQKKIARLPDDVLDKIRAYQASEEQLLGLR
jgi:acyl-CoA thioesterase FadM